VSKHSALIRWPHDLNPTAANTLAEAQADRLIARTGLPRASIAITDVGSLHAIITYTGPELPSPSVVRPTDAENAAIALDSARLATVTQGHRLL